MHRLGTGDSYGCAETRSADSKCTSSCNSHSDVQRFREGKHHAAGSVSQMTPVFIVKALKCQACGGREVFDEAILKQRDQNQFQAKQCQGKFDRSQDFKWILPSPTPSQAPVCEDEHSHLLKSVTQSFLKSLERSPLVLFKQVASLVPDLSRLVAPKGLKQAVVPAVRSPGRSTRHHQDLLRGIAPCPRGPSGPRSFVQRLDRSQSLDFCIHEKIHF